MRSISEILLRATVSNDGIGSPKQRVRVSEFWLAIRTNIAGSIYQSHHRLSQCLSARQLGIVGLALKQIGDQLPRRFRMYGPVGEKHRARPGIEERPTQAGRGFGA